MNLDVAAPASGRDLGAVYEENLRRRPAVRKARGAYYTPEPIVQQVVVQSVRPALAAHLAALPEGTSLYERLAEFRVCDPAMGTGYFLLAAAEAICEELRRGLTRDDLSKVPEELETLVVRYCLFGTDTDPAAVRIARASLRALASGSAEGADVPELESHLRCGDALAGTPEQALLQWGLCGGRGFQVVLGNPPWLSYSGRQAVAHPAVLQETSHELGHGRVTGRNGRAEVRAERAAGWPSAHGDFIKRAVAWLHPGGRLGFVIPAQVADLPGFGPVRGFLAARGTVAEPCEYHGERAFQGVIGPSITLLFARGVPAPSQTAGWRIAGQHRPGVTQRDERLLEGLASRLGTLEHFGDAVFGDPGVHTGNASADLLCDAEASGTCLAPIREGRDVLPFRLLPPRRQLRLDVQPADGRYFRIGRLATYVGCPIVLRQTASRPIAALHREPAYFRNSVLACNGAPGLSREALVALLNSDLFAWLHQWRFRDARQRTFPQVKVSHLRTLPRPLAIAEAYVDRLAECAGRLESLLTGCPAGDEPPQATAETVRLNSLVFDLYDVSEPEAAAITRYLAS